MSLIDINLKEFGVKVSKVKTNNKEDQALEVILPVTVATLTVTSLYSVKFIVTHISLFSYCDINTNSIRSGRTKYKLQLHQNCGTFPNSKLNRSFMTVR